MRLSRWEMMLSRPRFLSSLLAMNHGAHDVSQVMKNLLDLRDRVRGAHG